MKVAIGPSSFGDADETPLQILAEAGIEVVLNPVRRRLTREEIITHLTDVDGLIAGLEPLDREVLTDACSLKAIARVGIGMSNVDQEAAAELGIRVSNTPEAPTAAVVEATLAAMLYFARGLGVLNADMHARRWEKKLFPGLCKRTVLIVGYGRIGRALASVLDSFRATVLVTDPAITHQDLTNGHQLVDLGEGLRRADFVTLHASGEAVILDEAELAIMKPGAVLLNAARGSLVAEEALNRVLAQGRLGGVWIDTFWREPYEGPLTDRPEVLLTPHSATYTLTCRSEMETQAVRNLLRDLQRD